MAQCACVRDAIMDDTSTYRLVTIKKLSTMLSKQCIYIGQFYFSGQDKTTNEQTHIQAIVTFTT